MCGFDPHSSPEIFFSWEENLGNCVQVYTGMNNNIIHVPLKLLAYKTMQLITSLFTRIRTAVGQLVAWMLVHYCNLDRDHP